MTTRVMSYDFDSWRTTNGERFMVNNKHICTMNYKI